MEPKLKVKLLKGIGNIYEKSKQCKLDPPFFKKISVDLRLLSEYFSVTHKQSFLIAMAFALKYKDESLEIKDLINYFDCNPIKILEFNEDFEVLCSKGILKKHQSTRRLSSPPSDHYTINEKVTEAILNNSPMPQIEMEESTDVIEILEKIYKLSEERDNEELSTFDLFRQTKGLIASNLHFPLVKKINDFQFSIEETYLYIYLIWKTIAGEETTDISKATSEIFDNSSKKFHFIQSILANESKLIKHNYIEIIEAGFFNDTEIKLSNNSAQMLEEFGMRLFANKSKRDNVIEPKNIAVKDLYFNDSEHQQLDLLKNMLQEDNYCKMQDRLQSKNLPKGVTVLLHGSPGTGKTETVLQLAKSTNREILKVDISQSKSMWFGESEKIIKRIFTDYKAYAKKCDYTPILLFNEADAIISKRMENGISNISQTLNAIQNIILEELENFEGIFFATTNLVNNLDKAFERRFLFKVEFKKPEKSTKAKIWNSKLPCLSDAECEILANRFNFSGGQIENIVRKYEMHHIIYGTAAEFGKVIEFCEAELLTKNNAVRIGFSND